MAEKWIQDAVKRPGALSKTLGIPEDQDIPLARIKSELAKLKKKENLTEADKRLQKQLQFALTMKTKVNKKSSLRLQIMRLAYTNPDLRQDLLPLLSGD